jgi:long-subunit acyl-CoA synthetase (AMP-forming)
VPGSARQASAVAWCHLLTESGSVCRWRWVHQRVERVKRFAILDRYLSQETGELPTARKAKRAVVYPRFSDVIHSLYA